MKTTYVLFVDYIIIYYFLLSCHHFFAVAKENIFPL